MISFSGIDIVSDRRLARPALRTALSELLTVRPSKIAIVDDLLELMKRKPAELVVAVSHLSGEFVMLVSIQTAPREIEFETALEFVGHLAQKLAARFLVPTADPNPYRMWEVSSERPPRLVSMDTAALDDNRFLIRPP